MDQDTKQAYIDLHGEHYWDEEHCEDSFIGQFDFYSDLKEYIIDSFYECNEVPDNLVRFIDDEHKHEQHDHSYGLFKNIFIDINRDQSSDNGTK